MAQKITLIDDIDGTYIAEGEGGTFVYSVGGVTYAIDLTAEHTAQFESVLAPYIAKSRKVPTAASTGHRRAKDSSSDVAAIRQWARENGVPVSERGRIAATVRAAYEAAK